MPVNPLTTAREYPVPGEGNDLDYDFPRLVTAFEMIDADVAAIFLELATKITAASPALTGSPTAPTATLGDSSTKIATTAFVAAAIANLISANPSLGDLETVLAGKASIGDVATLTSALLAKANTASPTFTGVPAAPTPAASTNTTQIATTAFVQALTALAAPAGKVGWFAQNTAPSGWLKANGAAVSRTTYAGLFAAIGTTFGAGDGSTTFNVPDLRGEFVRGWDDSRGVDAARAFGSAQSDELKAHTHTYSRPSSIGQGTAAGNNINAGGFTTLDTNSTGGTETRPRNVALLACIKF